MAMVTPDGRTISSLAQSQGHPHTATWLERSTGWAPIHRACDSRSGTQRLIALLREGADPALVSAAGETPLQICALADPAQGALPEDAAMTALIKEALRPWHRTRHSLTPRASWIDSRGRARDLARASQVVRHASLGVCWWYACELARRRDRHAPVTAPVGQDRQCGRGQANSRAGRLWCDDTLARERRTSRRASQSRACITLSRQRAPPQVCRRSPPSMPSST